ncbi:Lrp/AsnC ligand binding domain-containing protein, partial [Paraburkholderia sp.]|uniref:Lrp/AsnC ligand binding domain-containing protein n=1 Tax=Paraburkholderia sp. TaxID=1926495 RepID=UPI002F3F4B75
MPKCDATMSKGACFLSGADARSIWCHNITGATDFLLCVVARNPGEYGRFIREKLRTIPGVISVESAISL